MEYGEFILSPVVLLAIVGINWINTMFQVEGMPNPWVAIQDKARLEKYVKACTEYYTKHRNITGEINLKIEYAVELMDPFKAKTRQASFFKGDVHTILEYENPNNHKKEKIRCHLTKAGNITEVFIPWPQPKIL